MKNFVTDFGANPLAPDNTAAIAAGLLASNGEDIFLPRGGYRVHSGALNWATRGRIVGEGYGDSQLLSLDAGGDLLTLSAGYSSIENIGFDSVVPRTGGAFLAMAPASGFNHISHVTMRGYYVGLKLQAAAGVTVRGLDIQDCSSTNGIAIDVACSPGTGLATSISGVLVSSTIPMGDPAFRRPAYGMRVKNSGDINLSDSSFILCQTALALMPDLGQELSSFRATAVDFDNSSNNGLSISPKGRVLRSSFTDCWFSSSGNFGVLIDTSAGGHVDMIGFASPQIFCNGGPGFYAIGSATPGWETRSINISNPQCAGNGGSGFLMGTTNESFSIRGGYSGNCGGFGGNARFGVEILPTAQQFGVDGIACNGNGMGQISNPGGVDVWKRIYGIPGVP